MQRQDLTSAMDLERPSQARIYDYLLGGSLNFAVDREAALRLLERVPDAALTAQANRAFLRRAVSFMVGAGVRQFLDIGSGVPTRGNVHEVAQELAPECRVAYVDIDPVAVVHARQLLAGDDRTVAIQGDARRPDQIPAHPDVRGLLDLAQPVAVLLVSVLHFVEACTRSCAPRPACSGTSPGSTWWSRGLWTCWRGVRTVHSARTALPRDRACTPAWDERRDRARREVQAACDRVR